ncbi:NADH dehydrogenase FAD-containing subunit [Nocardia tenerifensis]|uniref:NADH dehydrogenase FAD-containing subunit n=1 Tax=Nocardia tenerifensis TaxID=228006 RepID=A0A318K9H9_9NOCA|nr:FAD-dependent oxidoreductase [Nocardia tenerifensis]PXX71211.1 NADH dehydrogenase FAD-containing subunit [Nocardia tenerifensis]
MPTENTAGPQRVVIVGSGFAGFTCARKLCRLLAQGDRDVEVVLVTPTDYMLYTPLLPDVAGGLIDPRFVVISLADALPRVRLVVAKAESIDLQRKTITVTSDYHAPRELSWDRLVLTPGSVTRLFDVPGLAEHARGLKTVAEALYLREQMLRQLELADHEDDPQVRRARRTVVVVGASYAGTELVAQLRALADAYAHRRGFDPGEIRFVLLDMADRVMPEVGEKLGDKVLTVLRGRGIDIRLKTSLKELTDSHVVLTDDSVVPTHTVAWVTGVTGAPLLQTLDLPMERGRLVVDANLGVPGHPDVFAGGDAAAVPDLTVPGKITPPTAQHATRQGKALARNVAASLGIGHAAPYKHRDMGLVVDLGPGFAVANPLGVHMSGLLAKAVTRAYHTFAVPRGLNRWAITVTYATNLVTPRPLTLLGLVSPEESSFVGSEGIPSKR